MRQIDRYYLRQTLAPFAFFAMVLTCVIWLSQSLRVLDLILSNGQNAFVIMEFAALLLPVALSIVIPVSALGATIFALDRALGDSEIVTLYAAGVSKLSVVRPIIYFGLITACLLAAVTLYFMPVAAQTLKHRMAEIRGDLAAALIQDGQFMHPAPGLTIYINDVGSGGDMSGLLVEDARNPEDPVLYHARRGVLTRDDQDVLLLVMFEVLAQRVENDRMTLARFEKITYDLTPFMSDPTARDRKPSEYFFHDLVAPDFPRAENPRRYGKFIAEGHEQISAPLYGLALPLVAAAIMLGGRFRRRGYALSAGIAALGGTGVRVTGLAAKGAVTGTPELWPLFYIVPLGAIAIALLVLSRRRLPTLRPARGAAT